MLKPQNLNRTNDTKVIVKQILHSIAALKNDLAKDIYKNSQFMRLYNYLKNLEQSVYRTSQLNDAGIDEQAEREAVVVEKILDKILAEDIPENEMGNSYPNDWTKFTIKPSESTYIWKTEPGACKKCETMDGKEFGKDENIPDKLHPNCKCEVEKIEKPNENKNEDLPDRAGPRRLPHKRPGGSYPNGGEIPGRHPRKGPKTPDTIIIPDGRDDDETKRKKTFKLKLIDIIELVMIYFNKLKEKKDIECLPGKYWSVFLKNSPGNDKLGFTRLYQVRDFHLRDFIKKKYKVNNFSPVFIAKSDDVIYKAIADSPEILKFINKYYDDIKAGKYINGSISFAFTSFALGNTIHRCEIYNPHIDNEGNIVFTIVDLYDFALIKNYGTYPYKPFIILLNNISYSLQIYGYKGNYVIIIPVKVNGDKIKKYD